jgi:hypothetical protein
MGNWNDGSTWNGGGTWSSARVVIPTLIKHTHMRDIHIWPTNLFDDIKISLACLLAFASDHLQRMQANPLPVLAARITATNIALGNVSAAFSDDDATLGLRKARKQAKNDYRDALPALMGKIAVAVENQFGEKSVQFTQCFPHGRSVFSRSTDDELANNLQTVITGVGTLTPPLPAQVGTDAAALLTGWTAVFQPSESATGAKTNTIAAKNTARAALQLELFKNLLTLALFFPRQPEQLDLYMQQSLLEPHTQSPSTPAPTPTPPATPGA